MLNEYNKKEREKLRDEVDDEKKTEDCRKIT